MKLYKVLSHPYTLIICFLMILISGEQWGGFYAFYLLMALSFGGVHAILALIGIFILLASHHWINKQIVLKQVLNIAGVIFLFCSIYYFFLNDKRHYNWGTFRETVPLLTIIITACVAICFLVGTFLNSSRKKITAPI